MWTMSDKALRAQLADFLDWHNAHAGSTMR